MVRSFFIRAAINVSLALALAACGAIPLAGSPSQVEIRETRSQTVTTTEVIRINNCGGKGESKQVSERSLSVSVEGSVGAAVGYAVVQGSVSEKYSQYKSVTKRHEMSAPPGTNMEFTLQWIEQEWAGTVLANGQSGNYLVHAPLSVEQVSSKDHGGCPGGAPQTAPLTSAAPKPTLQPPAGAPPSPAPTLVPTRLVTATPSFLVLNQADTYSNQGLEVYLDRVDIRPGDFIAHLILKNNTGSKLLFRFDTQSYYGMDNLGNQGRTYIYGCSSALQHVIFSGCGDMSMPAGDTFDIELALGGINASNDQVTEIMLVIRQLSRIKNIGFRIKVPH